MVERAIIIRRRAGLRQDEIAAALGCSRWLVNRMEREEAPICIAPRLDLAYKAIAEAR